ncbi:MAG: hypothetical protein EOP51_25790 [Sphingobacteriales bacterium]|nr:MAG: hypothetical protein EOP51_25790 [Sphingobacteriales bacterium]
MAMMRATRKFLFLLLICDAAEGSLHAQFVFTGRVVNASQQPIAGANLLINQTLPVGSTNADGRFRFEHSASTFQLSISHVGFVTLVLNVDSLLPALIVLQRNTPLEEEAVVYAFEGNGHSRNLAAAVTVLTKNDLQRLGTGSLVAAVNTVPGVKMDERSPGSYRLSIRGNLLRSTFGVRNVKVYWNGIPFTDASGNTYLNQVSPENLGSMEVLKGPSGSMYGSGTGGVVLLGTGRNATDTGKHVDVKVTGGSYGLFSASAAYEKQGPQATRLSVSHQQADGYRQHTRMRRDVAHFTGSYRLSAKHTVSTNILYSDLFYQTPGGLTAAEQSANPRQARPAAGAFRSAVTQQAAVYLRTIYAGVSSAFTLRERWKWTTGLYGSGTDFKNPTIRNYEKKSEKGIGARSVLQYKHRRFTGTAGAELQQGYFNTDVFGNDAGRQDTLQFNAVIQSRQANIFAQAEVMLPKG